MTAGGGNVQDNTQLRLSNVHIFEAKQINDEKLIKHCSYYL